jgi:hypothetical protein
MISHCLTISFLRSVTQLLRERSGEEILRFFGGFELVTPGWPTSRCGARTRAPTCPPTPASPGFWPVRDANPDPPRSGAYRTGQVIMEPDPDAAGHRTMDTVTPDGI